MTADVDVRMIGLIDVLADLDDLEVVWTGVEEGRWDAGIRPVLCDAQECQEYAHPTESSWIDLEAIVYVAGGVPRVQSVAMAAHPGPDPGRMLQVVLTGPLDALDAFVAATRAFLDDTYRRGTRR